MKKYLLFSLSVLLSLSLMAQRISIRPSILDFHLGPNSTQSQAVSITNLSDKKMSFQAYMADWLRDSTGGHQYFRPDTLQTSCAKWIKLSKNFIEIEPGKTEEVIVQLQAPKDTVSYKTMRWAMLFLQSADEQDSASRNNKQVQTQIKEILRVGIHIYQTPPFLNKYAAKAIAFNPVEKKDYEFVMQNVGEVMLQCKAYVELTNIEDGTEYKLDKVEFPVFPQGVRKVKFSVPEKIPAGKYSALAIVDIGEDMPLEAIERTIEIK